MGSYTSAALTPSFEEIRATFPVLDRFAYLNAGTNGPLARATFIEPSHYIDRVAPA